jgi:WD40 repeat protein
VAVAITPNGQWFVSGSNDKTLKLWDTSKSECIHTYTGQASVKSLSISSDGSYIVSCGEDEIIVWNIETGKYICKISNQPYEGMRIGGAIGLTSGQIESLKALGAVDD